MSVQYGKQCTELHLASYVFPNLGVFPHLQCAIGIKYIKLQYYFIRASLASMVIPPLLRPSDSSQHVCTKETTFIIPARNGGLGRFIENCHKQNKVISVLALKDKKKVISLIENNLSIIRFCWI